MFRRLAGRLVTSPAAFLVAGLLDLGGFWLAWFWLRVRAWLVLRARPGSRGA